MRIEVVDWVNYGHVIDTDDPLIAGKWFARKAEQLMSADTRTSDLRMRIWPTDRAESQTIGQWENRLTKDNLLEFARHLLNVAEKLGELEAAG